MSALTLPEADGDVPGVSPAGFLEVNVSDGLKSVAELLRLPPAASFELALVAVDSALLTRSIREDSDDDSSDFTTMG